MLIDKSGDDYVACMSRTGRYIPPLRKAKE